jgi:lantibiotic leader peptide-processing serine protease
MRNKVVAALAVTVVLASLAVAVPGASAGRTGPLREYVVLYEKGVSLDEARAELKALGAKIVRENTAIGLATVRTRNADFLSNVLKSGALFGAAGNRPIGKSIPIKHAKRGAIEKLTEVVKAGNGASGKGSAARAANPNNGDEPFANKQWNMKMINATSQGSYALNTGLPTVLVGIIDTGVDARHKDIKQNFNKELSRNFTTDIPEVDGPCNEEPDESCEDPATVDESGHGTHVAGIVAASINGLGVSGVAPGVSIVNLRGGQDSGYFFLQASVDALTYAGDNGIDVVNMSYFIDPWLYNCTNNPDDTPEQQMEQQTIITATQAALNYAHDHNVTLIGASGNDHTDLGNPTHDEQSPNFPPGNEHPRDVDNTCLDLPTEGDHVMSINSVGPSGRKSYFSNYGIEQTTVAAPGGDYYDFPGTNKSENYKNTILSSYPRKLAIAEKGITKDFKVLEPWAKVDCYGKKKNKKNCAVYEYLQGTSMASPHATGVAALIISEFGTGGETGVTMDPDDVQAALEESASDTPCPIPNPYTYPDHPDPEYTATCEDPPDPSTFNGFYGFGIVDALAAITGAP